MSSTYDFNVTLYRDSLSTPWGFRMEGGRDFNKSLTIQRVFTGSPAAGELQRGDIILAIEHKDTGLMAHQQANELIKHTGGSLHLSIRRGLVYSGSQTLPRMHTYRPTSTVTFNSQPPFNRSLYNQPQANLFYAEDPLSSYIRNRPIEKVKDPKPILSQTGSPILPGCGSGVSSRPSIKRYHPSHTTAVIPQLPKTNFEVAHQPAPMFSAPSYNFLNTNQTPTPFNDKKMVNQIQSSLKRAVNAHHYAPAPTSYFPSYNTPKSYNQVAFSPPSASKPVQFQFDNSAPSVPEWRHSLKKTGYNIYEDQQQPSTQSLQSSPSFAHHQPQQPKGPRVVNLQYNSPIGLYSRQNIDEELHKKIGNQSHDYQIYTSSEF